MKKILTIALLFFIMQVQAQERIGVNEALVVAKHFLSQQSKQQNTTLSLNDVICNKDSGEPNLFVFSIASKGFIIVSALNEVLAYSFGSTLPSSGQLPDHINYWLDLYNDRTE